MPRVDAGFYPQKPGRPEADGARRAASGPQRPEPPPLEFGELLRRRTLAARRDDAPAEEAAPCAPAPESLAGWLRPEGPNRACEARTASGAASSIHGDRFLLGTGPGGAEIRLCIGTGPLAGSEIHLRQGRGGVEATLLTRVESSRQTLSMALDEVARRLRRKGVVLIPGSDDRRGRCRSPSDRR